MAPTATEHKVPTGVRSICHKILHQLQFIIYRFNGAAVYALQSRVGMDAAAEFRCQMNYV